MHGPMKLVRSCTNCDALLVRRDECRVMNVSSGIIVTVTVTVTAAVIVVAVVVVVVAVHDGRGARVARLGWARFKFHPIELGRSGREIINNRVRSRQGTDNGDDNSNDSDAAFN